MKSLFAFIRRETREAFPAFVFFFAIFELGRITRALVLEEVHVTVGTTTVAAIGALIVAKAILVADALPFSSLFARRALAWSIAWKSLIYGLITLAFHYLEELISVARKYGGLAAGQERLLEEFSWPHFWVVQLWVFFSLLLFCAGRELARAGRGPLRGIVVRRRRSPLSAGSAAGHDRRATARTDFHALLADEERILPTPETTASLLKTGI